MLGNVPGSLVYAETEPVSKAKNGLTVSMMRGLDYNDPKWDALLDQIDWGKDKDGILMSFTGAAYATGAIPSIGLPGTVEQDGANGLKVNGAGDGGYDITTKLSENTRKTQKRPPCTSKFRRTWRPLGTICIGKSPSKVRIHSHMEISGLVSFLVLRSEKGFCVLII